jgi:large subunit ribosomal protein L24e
MVQKRTCNYTGEEIEPGTGIMYVANDGTILHFVDSKAEKNYLLGREARDLEWTAAGRANKGPAVEQVEQVNEEPDAEEETEADAKPDFEAVEEDVDEVQDDAEAVEEDVDEVQDDAEVVEEDDETEEDSEE